ncbi:MAG: ribulose-phosphate 3-epimerase [Clostridiales bacterium]|jgi:ribulose-phosphate 3-epimerase|nr:ribulose-phosphate 3-epimerase [Clostridiales bacterium]
MVKIAPSVLAADILHLQQHVQRVLDAGADLLHLDIMDAHFVPNLSFGPDLVRALHGAFPDAYLDVHLMMTNPEQYVRPFADAGANAITIHAEIGSNALDALKLIKSLGVEAGISFKPATSVYDHQPLLSLCDLALIMSVEPGFGGQKMIPEVLNKAQDLRKLGFKGNISVDGGINAQNAAMAIEKGFDWLVMGTAVFGADDPAKVIADVHALARG